MVRETREPEFKIPQKLGAVADLLYTTRQRRLDLEKAVQKLQEQETLLKNHIIDTLPADDATGIAGELARVSVVVKQQPRVTDWPALYSYVARTKSWELLQRRVSDSAVRERWELGKEVAGVEAFGLKTVSINKVG